MTYRRGTGGLGLGHRHEMGLDDSRFCTTRKGTMARTCGCMGIAHTLDTCAHVTQRARELKDSHTTSLDSCLDIARHGVLGR